jgi:serine/threonine protein kinase
VALPRVYDIAKELGIDSKVALSKLAELGHFVKSGSSTISPGVANQLRNSFPSKTQVGPGHSVVEDERIVGNPEVNNLELTSAQAREDLSSSSNCIDRFTLLNKIGEGGLSQVFKGLDDTSNSVVAVKVVDDLGDGLSKALWKKEVDCLSKLSHPNVVRLLCSGSRPKGETQEFLVVLEWLEETLAERYGRSSYSFEPNSWLKYSRGLVDGLAHAHQFNVAHRDIKPDNLLFKKKDDADRKIIIADFGISKNLENETDTRTVADFGSMVFSPPDHASRDPFSRDVYSAAAVLVQLTSPVLFRDTLDLLKALEAITALPAALISLLRNALDLDPENRPKNMVEFKSRFDSIVSQNSRKAERPAALQVPVKFTNKPKEHIMGGPALHFERVKAKFESLIASSELFAQIRPPKKDVEGDSNAIHLSTNEWVFTLKVNREDGAPPYLLLVAAQEPDFDDLERWRFGSLELEDRFRFVALDTRQPVPASNGLDLLEKLLSQHAPDASNDEISSGSFETWSRLLDAREELVRGSFRTMDFSSVRVESGSVVFTLTSDLESDISDTSWEVKDFRGVYFEVTNFDGTQVWAKPSREIGTINQRGQLVPSLGRDAVSLSRQRTAVQEFKAGEAVSKDIGFAVESPNDAVEVTAQSEITPVLSKLDPDKIGAVQAALSTEDVFVVQGPPGTGKTNFIAELVHQIKKNKPDAKVLLVAQTHVAVDNALLRLEESGFTDMLRIGDPKDPRLHPDALKYLVERKIKEWIEGIRISSESDLMKRAGIEGSGLEQLKALALLSELNASRKQAAYLNAKAAQTTTAFADSLNEEDDAKLDSAISNIEVLQDGLRNKLRAVSGPIADRESGLNDAAMDDWVQEFIDKFPNPDQLMKLLAVQTGWLLKVHTDDDLRLRFLNSAGLVSGTCVGFLRESAVRKMEFDYCIVDEASKATATETLVPMSKAHHVILVGDENQLPPNDEELLENPAVMQNHSLREADVKTTLFGLLKSHLPDSKKAILTTQWRMSKAIGDLISHCFYDGELESVNTKQIEGYSSLVGAQVRWLDTSEHPHRMEIDTRGGGYTNRVEARVIANEVMKIAKLVISRHLKVDPETFEILIVSPYRAQKRAIIDELRQRDYGSVHVRVETADAVQGSEADIVIVATTRSNSKGRLGFLGQAQWKRINVALSRARYGLIVVGDATFIDATSGGLSQALDYIKSHSDTCEIVKVDSNA